MNFMSNIEYELNKLKKNTVWVNYLNVRELVSKMMDECIYYDNVSMPSDYWHQEIAGFDYLFDASPLIINKLREHCYHITGIKSYDYRGHHIHAMKNFQWKFEQLKRIDKSDLFVPESKLLGGFGFPLSSGLTNIDTLKFYEVMIGIDMSGFLDPFLDFNIRPVVLEIGSGWGGFAYTFKKLFPDSTYICIDLPPTLLFSATYIKSIFPNSRCLIYGEEEFDKKFEKHYEYDFIFIPNYYFHQIKAIKIDLAINMVSFQEMTTAQVEWYLKILKSYNCQRIYSLNRDRSKYNSQITSVSETISKYYHTIIVKLLNLQYVNLKPTKGNMGDSSPLDYQHIAATLL